jgi:hypothetical protein
VDGSGLELTVLQPWNQQLETNCKEGHVRARQIRPALRRPCRLPTLTLPKGGGAIRGICGEKFAGEARDWAARFDERANRVQSLVVGLRARNFLSLRTIRCAGTAPFRFRAWRPSVPSIARKPDKRELPRYPRNGQTRMSSSSRAEANLVPLSTRQDDAGAWVRDTPRPSGRQEDVLERLPRRPLPNHASKGQFARIRAEWTASSTTPVTFSLALDPRRT